MFIFLIADIANTPTTIASALVLLGGGIIAWLLNDRKALTSKIDLLTKENVSILREQIETQKALDAINETLGNMKKQQ